MPEIKWMQYQEDPISTLIGTYDSGVLTMQEEEGGCWKQAWCATPLIKRAFKRYNKRCLPNMRWQRAFKTNMHVTT
jgi:hypothetical protein